jgi:hypothetical protein
LCICYVKSHSGYSMVQAKIMSGNSYIILANSLLIYQFVGLNCVWVILGLRYYVGMLMNCQILSGINYLGL